MRNSVATMMNIMGIIRNALIDPSSTVMSLTWEWKDVDSISVDVSPNGMNTTISITSNPGTFFKTSIDNITYDTIDINESGNFTLYVKAQGDNDDTINSGSITISDDNNNAEDVVINITQEAAPV